jgi:glycosyltransferase involved in cell wall biosynthesis
MRVGYLTSQYPYPSITFVRRELNALRARGVEIQTFSVRTPSVEERGPETDRRDYESTWYVLPVRPLELLRDHARALASRPLAYLRSFVAALRHRVPGTMSLLYSLFYFAEAIRLAGELERREIEHLHNHFGNAGAIVGYLASHYLELDWSLSLHGISELDHPYGSLLGDKIRHARFVACAHHFMRAQAMRTVGPEHWSKLVIVRCGVEMDRLPVPDPRSADDDRLRVVCVGRLSPEKGHAGLLDAFAKVVADGVDAELRLIGDGPDSAVTRAHAERLGLGDRCSLPGRASEPDSLAEIARADVFVLSSLMEGLPVVLMEALALQVPVIAPCVGGIWELVQHEVTGLLFPPADWEALQQCLRRMLADPELRERTADAGRARIVEEFDIERAIEPLLQRFSS